MTSPVSRAVFLMVLAATSAACGSSSSTGDAGTGGVDGEAGEGNASGGKAGSVGKGGSDGKGGKGGDSGLGGEGGEGASDGANPACDDAILNGSETDVDCGGPECQPCVTGQKCDAASDCKSEVCDPGTDVCLEAKCGDGVVNRVAEACDDGADNSDIGPSACRTTCVLATCGDGAVDDGEECDSGAQNSDTAADACRTACKLANCGDGVLDGEEECDNGEQNSDAASDACRTSCLLPRCGDGVLDGEEECDDGELNGPTAPCRSSCTKGFCGDGIQDADEQCDAGELNSDTAPDACRTSCTLPGCGDDVIDEGEACDDGNQEDDLTCAADCQAPCGGSAGRCDGEVSSYCASDGSAVLTEQCDPLQGLSCDAESGLCAGSCAERNLGSGSTGCDFRATDLKQADGFGNVSSRLVFTNATAAEASVTVTREDTVATFAVPANSRYEHQLAPVSALRSGSTTVAVDSAFRVRSTVPLSAFQHTTPASGTSDSAALLPVRHWGTEYVVSSWTGALVPAFVTVVALEDETTVTLKAPVSVNANAAIGVNADGTGTIVLGAEDVLQVVSTGDLTGTRLSSDKPIEVFGGSGCANVPVNVLYCDHLSEVMPPIPSLGTTHVVVPPRRHEGGERATFVRVIATEPDTALTYVPALASAPSTIAGAGQFVELGPVNAAVRITSSSKVLVSQYYPSHNYGNSMGDPAMITLAPVPAFLSAYDFSTSSGYNDYISVLLPSDATATLDGAPLTGFTAVTDAGFQYVNVPVTGVSPHRVECSAGCRVDLLGLLDYESYWHGVGRAYSGY